MKEMSNLVDYLMEEILHEQEWNKDSKTPRDYSKEYNPPGSKEQEERNKRKRDKRKHDKEQGKCPHNQDLHHVDGIENDKVKCEPPYLNRGRKEKSRLKGGEVVLKIKEHQLKIIIQEETEKVLNEQSEAELQRMRRMQRVSMGAMGRRYGRAAPVYRGATPAPKIASDIATGIEKHGGKTVHLVLDVTGFIPGFGNFADLSNVWLYASEQKPLMAAFSAVAMLPAVGSAIAATAKQGGSAVAKILGPTIMKYFTNGVIPKLFQKLAAHAAIGKFASSMFSALKEYAIGAIKGKLAKEFTDETRGLMHLAATKPANKAQIAAMKKAAKRLRKPSKAAPSHGTVTESGIDQIYAQEEEPDKKEIGAQKRAKKTIAKQTPTTTDDETMGDLLKRIVQEEAIAVFSEYNTI